MLSPSFFACPLIDIFDADVHDERGCERRKGGGEEETEGKRTEDEENVTVMEEKRRGEAKEERNITRKKKKGIRGRQDRNPQAGRRSAYGLARYRS